MVLSLNAFIITECIIIECLEMSTLPYPGRGSGNTRIIINMADRNEPEHFACQNVELSKAAIFELWANWCAVNGPWVCLGSLGEKSVTQASVFYRFC